MRTFSSTDSSGKMLVIWNVREMPRRQRARRRQRGDVVAGKSTRPAVGASQPEIRWKNVVLPAPFGPMTARSSAGLDREADAVDGLQGAEVAPEPPRLEHRRLGTGLPRHPRSPPAAGRAGAAPARPAGRSTIRTNTDAGEDHPVLGIARQDLLDEDEHHRAHDGPDQRADAAHDYHHQSPARRRPRT